MQSAFGRNYNAQTKLDKISEQLNVFFKFSDLDAPLLAPKRPTEHPTNLSVEIKKKKILIFFVIMRPFFF